MPAAKEGMKLSDLISHFTKSTGQFMPRNKYGKPVKPEGGKVEETKPEPPKVAEKVSEKTSKEPSYERRRH